MANYKAYPKQKDTPSRLSRKGSRRVVYLYNKMANRKAKEAKYVRRENME